MYKYHKQRYRNGDSGIDKVCVCGGNKVLLPSPVASRIIDKGRVCRRLLTWRTHMRRVLADCRVSGVDHTRALHNCTREALQRAALDAR